MTIHVDEIAREAGAGRALVNHYFGDKRGLFLAVARRIVERVPTTVRADLGTHALIAGGILVTFRSVLPAVEAAGPWGPE